MALLWLTNMVALASHSTVDEHLLSFLVLFLYCSLTLSKPFALLTASRRVIPLSACLQKEMEGMGKGIGRNAYTLELQELGGLLAACAPPHI
jgi:hypothetical protein